LGKRANPYVGPRPFRKGELFFGREREARSVVNSLLSCRIMLLHAPSGAGKTSLIQASVVPSFQERGFLICAGTDTCAGTESRFTALRVNLPPPDDVPNPYLFSVVNGLVGHFTDHDRARGMTVASAIEEFARHHNSQQRQLLVIDQLEEVLRLDPGDIEGQITFFKQLGEALDDNRRWALLAMREDYMGALDRFRQYLPGQLRSISRLDFLDEKAALRAVQKPTRESGVEFDDDAARMLVTGLQGMYSGGTPTMKSPYVEPVLLQVVCYDLFRKLSKGSNFDAITVKDIEDFKPFYKSISKYYRGVVRDAKEAVTRDAKEAVTRDAKEAVTRDAKEAVVRHAKEAIVRDPVKEGRRIEQDLRDWVEQDLISRQGLRRQTRQKPQVQEADTALSAMRDLYLIHDDPRLSGSPLWELSHDMLIGPVREDNRAWRRENLEEWQVRAEEWRASGQNEIYLLHGSEYLTAPSHRRRAGLTQTEQAFLEKSGKAFSTDGRMARLKAQRRLFSGLLALSLLVNLLLLVLVSRPF
jgi:hypothetical protein